MLLSFLTGCEQGDGSEPKEEVRPLASFCRVAKLYDLNDTTQYTLYQYGYQNRVLQAKGYYKGKEKSTITYEYNNLGQLITVDVRERNFDFAQEYNGGYHQVYTFEYNSQGQVAKYVTSDLQNNNPGPIFETICTYDSEGNRIKTTTTVLATALTAVSYFTYENGNCVKAIINEGQESERTNLYEFDLTKENKLQAFEQASNLSNLLGPTANKNMLLLETRSYKVYTATSGTFEFFQEYNDQGYPTKQIFTRTSSYGQGTTSRLFEYDCL
ncbi:hypothetical protein [Adhaeribacter arboris]|uniref:hypothetical protein n=1 Tax=Adhaeribacter arboris TaxID=2072846 RepID=UPI0011B27D97|nr:hypothetical protein [Adhaeribacter arboris]